MLNDLDLAELKTYLPPRDEPADFDAFWQQSIADARQRPLDARFKPIKTYLKAIDSFDVEFSGYGGQSVRGWLNVPRARDGRLPCVVEYIGYGGGRGIAQDWLLYSAAGYAHFVMDSRGQGGGWRTGDTPDIPEVASPHYPGFTTLGVRSPHDYYYRRLYVDAVRAVEAARTSELVDPERVAVAGNSQGGGTALAAAGLADNLLAVMPGVPFMCHISRAIRITDALPYFEITRYLRANPLRYEQTLRTLSYFDGVNFAARAKAPALFSVALMDQTCPPSTVYAAYNHYAAPKDIRVWEFNDHDGAAPQQAVEILRFLEELV
jgi:cephalosporin-C deacetylase